MITIARRTFLISTAGFLATSSRANAEKAEKGDAPSSKFESDRFIADVRRARAEDDSQKADEEVIARAVPYPDWVKFRDRR